MSKRSSRARWEARQKLATERGNHAVRRAEAYERRFALSRMAWGDEHARRCDDGKLPDTRQGVMHSGFSPSQVYSRRGFIGTSAVTDARLYGDRVTDYRHMRDAAKIAKRENARAIEQAARARRAEEQAARARREGTGWA